MIIIIVFSLIALPNPKSIPGERKKQFTFSMAIENVELIARVFSRTLAHENSKIEISERNRRRRQAETSENDKNYIGK